MACQDRRPVLAAERQVPPLEADQVEHLREVGRVVRDGNEPPAVAHDPRQLAQGHVEIGHVVQHPRGHRDVERAILERQLLDVADPGVDSAATRELDHALRPVERDQLEVELRDEPLGQLALAAADLEDARRLGLTNRLERDVARVDAADLGVDRLPGP